MPRIHKGPRLQVWARKQPDRLAIQHVRGDRTFLQLAHRVDALAHALNSLGIEPGQRLALLCRHRAEFLEVLLAGEQAGIFVVPIHPDQTVREIEECFRTADVSVLILEDAFASHIGPVRGLDELKLVSIGSTSLQVLAEYEELVAASEGEAFTSTQPVSPIFFSSGSTGRPKAVLRLGLATGPHIEKLVAAAQYDPGRDLYLQAVQMYLSAPYGLGAKMALSHGVGVRLTEGLEPEQVLAEIAANRASHTLLSPFWLRRLVALPSEVTEKYDVSSLRMIITGGAPCSVKLKNRVRDLLGSVLFEYYAGTEGGGTIIGPQEAEAKPGSVGKVEGDCIQITSESGETCRPGEVGRILINRHKNTAFTYLGLGAGDRTNPDWHDTGDLGSVDEDGFLFLTGRTLEIINVRGIKVPAREVEEVLLEHPAVEDVAAFPVSDTLLGEAVGVALVLRSGNSEDDAMRATILKHSAEFLAPSKTPVKIIFTTSLPRTLNGKLARANVLKLMASSAN